jgi:translation elongation factor EF-Tu-like GTPase
LLDCFCGKVEPGDLIVINESKKPKISDLVINKNDDLEIYAGGRTKVKGVVTHVIKTLVGEADTYI